MPVTPEVIDISWSANPPGQVGKRPRTVALHGTFRFNSLEDGELKIEFKNGSPLKDGVTVVKAGDVLEAVNAGNFKFICHLTRPDGTDQVLDPDNPKLPGGGGEMQVLPDGAKGG